jgi:hypothetical protein
MPPVRPASRHRRRTVKPLWRNGERTWPRTRRLQVRFLSGVPRRRLAQLVRAAVSHTAGPGFKSLIAYRCLLPSREGAGMWLRQGRFDSAQAPQGRWQSGNAAVCKTVALCIGGSIPSRPTPVLVAQLESAAPSEGAGRPFESGRGREGLVTEWLGPSPQSCGTPVRSRPRPRRRFPLLKYAHVRAASAGRRPPVIGGIGANPVGQSASSRWAHSGRHPHTRAPHAQPPGPGRARVDASRLSPVKREVTGSNPVAAPQRRVAQWQSTSIGAHPHIRARPGDQYPVANTNKKEHPHA